jgi:hypothetical protein
MHEDDLEPIAVDLEPVDLEPETREPLDQEWQLEQARIRRRVWIFWGALAAACFAIWAIASSSGGGNHLEPAPPLDRGQALIDELRLGLKGVGSSRFAAVINDRLYVFDESRAGPTLVPLPEGHAAIQDVSGSSLLVSTFEETLVSTQPAGTRTLSPRDTPVRAVAPGKWWRLSSGGIIRPDPGGDPIPVPPGLRVVAAVNHDFLAQRAPDSAWVLWSPGSTTTTVAPAGYQLLFAGPETIVFKHGCGYNGCFVETSNFVRRVFTTNRLSVIPQYAALSSDGRLVALASTLGDVFIVDTRTGRVLPVRGVRAQNVSLPFSWTPDGRSLVVVGDHDVRVLRASDGFATAVIAKTDGVEQIVALP